MHVVSLSLVIVSMGGGGGCSRWMFRGRRGDDFSGGYSGIGPAEGYNEKNNKILNNKITA